MSNIRYNARARLRVIGKSQRQRKLSPRQLGLSLRQAGRSPRQIRAAAAALMAISAPGAPAECPTAPGPAQTMQPPEIPAQRPGPAARRRYSRAYLTSWANRLIWVAWNARNKAPSAPAAPGPAQPMQPPETTAQRPAARPRNVWKQNRIDSIEQVKKQNAAIIAATFEKLKSITTNHQQQGVTNAKISMGNNTGTDHGGTKQSR